jgi:protocadherin Fat 1/2/3
VGACFQAVDDGRPAKTSTGTYTVNVIDVNEQPTFDTSVLLQLSVSENVASGTRLAVFTASDPDAADVGKLRFSWRNPVNSKSGTPMFALNATSGVLTTLGEIDFEFLETYPMQIRVTDLGGLHDDINVTMSIINVNEPPVITPGQAFQAVESWGLGRAVGVVAVTDPDAGSQFLFNIISGNLGAAFSIDTSSGLLSVSWDGALDYENIVVYNVTVSSCTTTLVCSLSLDVDHSAMSMLVVVYFLCRSL